MTVTEREYLTPEQVADLAQVDNETVLRWLRSRQLIGSKIGNKIWRIHRRDFDKFMEDRRLADDNQREDN